MELILQWDVAKGLCLLTVYDTIISRSSQIQEEREKNVRRTIKEWIWLKLRFSLFTAYCGSRYR